MKSRFMILLFAVALSASTAAAGVASAGSIGNVEASFTKWVVGDTDASADQDLFDMIGVVGGSIGAGTFTGEVFTYVDDGTTTRIDAFYHVNGSKLSFVAHNTVTQDDATGIANIVGTVVGGPLDGAHVSGGYRTMSTCAIPTPGNVFGQKCFKGTLLITP